MYLKNDKKGFSLSCLIGLCFLIGTDLANADKPRRGSPQQLQEVSVMGQRDPNEKVCVYRDKEGRTLQAPDRKSVPPQYRSKASCKSAGDFNNLAKPEDIKIDGSETRSSISTALGKIEARWPRSITKYFSRGPERALSDAAQAVSRALNQGGFPYELRSNDYPWKVVFIDSKLSPEQIPLTLISNCNPAWMTAPANIYVIAERIAGTCNGQGAKKSAGSADKMLAEVLVHEMGHVVEHFLLGQGHGENDPDFRMRGEGFATWFQSYASGNTKVIDDDEVAKRTKREAALEILSAGDSKSFDFHGTSGDYARASMYFHAIENRRGVKGILKSYELMKEKRITFFEAVQQTTGWSKSDLEKASLKATTK